MSRRSSSRAARSRSRRQDRPEAHEARSAIRLKRLETRQLHDSRPGVTVQLGHLKSLPPDYVGERHIVTVNRLPDGKYEWEFQALYLGMLALNFVVQHRVQHLVLYGLNLAIGPDPNDAVVGDAIGVKT
jgi:hypothetical protein